MNSTIKTFKLEASVFPWEIAPGKTIQAWGFNKSIPGAILEANQGDTIQIHFTNHLPEPTVIHWHGLRIPAAMDGTEDVQSPVMPGESFMYTLPLSDAGTFWFHSHMNETVQMERGLYGAIIVRGKDEPVVDMERVLVFDDMKLNKSLDFITPSWFLPRWLERHNGREGNTLLINGKFRCPQVKRKDGD
jgi:FtsP/CotA-like multicopper oxidase with cupredoxin domain